MRASRVGHWCTAVGCAAALLARQAAGGDVPRPPPVRLGSGPLMRSVQNEVDAAIARAQNWLAVQQDPEGSWGGGSPYLTAVCALALHAEGGLGPQASAAARIRAARWLRETPLPTGAGPCHARVLNAAWGAIVRRVIDPDAAAGSPPPAWSTEQEPDPLVILAWREARALDPTAGADAPSLPSATNVAERLIQAVQEPTPPPDLRERIEAVGRSWGTAGLLEWRETRAQRAWWLARAINRSAHGSLMLTPLQAIDWRRDLVDCWVNRQRIAPRGGGYWPVDGEPSIEETAFAILLLREL
ncbi:MAG: hypothetical protein RBS99_16300 [Rhodospirillales bacterium]|nr:hypothetical protein [Rhodospirillales bacterium]